MSRERESVLAHTHSGRLCTVWGGCYPGLGMPTHAASLCRGRWRHRNRCQSSGTLPSHILHKVHVFSALHCTFPHLPKALNLKHKEADKTRSSNNLDPLFEHILHTHLSFCATFVSVKTIHSIIEDQSSVIHEVPQSRAEKVWLWVPTGLEKTK